MSSGIFNSNSGYHNRKSIRFRGYDYSLPGAYFITVCFHDFKHKLFGNVVGGNMVENNYGIIVRQCWNNLPAHYPHIQLNEFIIMPNHVHGIIVIRHSASVGARSSRPDLPRSSRPISVPDMSVLSEMGRDNPVGRDNHAPTRAPTLGTIVAYFKYQSTKQINAIRQHGIEKIWQRNYYDHIIRDDKSRYFIRQYIRNNPANWSTDSEHHLNNEIDKFDHGGGEWDASDDGRIRY
jgi:putative transposase